jgi:hypothetical protein
VPERTPLTFGDLVALRSDVRDGRPVDAVAQHFGVSPDVVAWACLGMPVTYRSRPADAPRPRFRPAAERWRREVLRA